MAHTIALPHEILLNVLQHLDKKNLKSTRLVNKPWSGCSAVYLFKKVFISPHEINLNVFENICAHPTLRHYVRALEYEAVDFSPRLTLIGYFNWLSKHLPHTFVTRNEESSAENSSSSLNEEVNEFIELAIRNGGHQWSEEERREDAMTICKGFKFIRDGYKAYQSQATFQAQCLRTGTFQRALIQGLAVLDRLDTVILSDRWEHTIRSMISVDLTKSSSAFYRDWGSPLARSWTLFWAEPEPWRHGPRDTWADVVVSTGEVEFLDITRALSKTQKHIRTFRTRARIPPIAFNTEFSEPEAMLPDIPNAYCNLETLKLDLSAYGESPGPHVRANVDGICAILNCAPNMRYLDLNLPDDAEDDTSVWLPYSLVFAKVAHMPHVTAFRIHQMNVCTNDLLTLLLEKMPSLVHLELDNIELRDGRWEGIFEAIRIANHLKSLRLPYQTQLLHDGSDDYPPGHPYDDAYSDLLDDLQDYVIDWPRNPTSRHPSLSEEQPMKESLDYFEPTLHLCEQPNPDGTPNKVGGWLREQSELYQDTRIEATQTASLLHQFTLHLKKIQDTGDYLRSLPSLTFEEAAQQQRLVEEIRRLTTGLKKICE